MGTTTSNMSIYIPYSGEELYRPSFATGQTYIDLHQHTGPPTGGAQLISGSYSPGSITPAALSNQVRQAANYISNFGIAYSSGVFAVTASDGTSLSLSNLAFVTFQNALNPGQLVTLSLSVNQSFKDYASGSSQIAGNLFGTVSGQDSLSDVQFYLYAVINNTNTAIQLMICRLPCQEVSPTTSNIGMPSTPNAQNIYSFFSLGNIVASDFDLSPCVELGCFRMRKVGGALNDWVVQGFNSSDGIGACSCNANSSTPTAPPSVIGTSNLGITYAAGIFSIAGSNGAALEDTNPAFVTMESNIPGQLVTIEINNNQQFADFTSGSSTIAGNLFGLPTTVNYSNDLPFYVYACLDSSSDTIAFGIARMPNLNTAPIAANIGTGTGGLALASTQSSMFLLTPFAGSAPNPTNYASQAVLCIGSFRMQKVNGASNDWTVSALAISDGIGRFNDTVNFTIPPGGFGAVSGSLMSGAGAPIVLGNLNYTIQKGGLVNLTFDGTASAIGTNGNNLQMVLPLLPSNFYSTNENPVGVSNFITASTYTLAMVCVQQAQQNATFIYGNGTTNHVFNNTLNPTPWSMRMGFEYRI